MLNRRNVLKSLAALPLVGYLPASKAMAGLSGSAELAELKSVNIVYTVEHMNLKNVVSLMFHTSEHDDDGNWKNTTLCHGPICPLHEGETFQSVFSKFMNMECEEKINHYYHIIDKENSLYCLIGAENKAIHRIGSLHNKALSEDEIKTLSLEMKEKING